MQTSVPCLWFDNQAEAAAAFYVSVFPNSRILEKAYYGEAGPGPKGSVMTVRFRLDGQEFLGLNGGPAFKFSEAISFVVYCDTQDEIDHFWQRLSQGGKKVECGWLKDRYGLSWQIVPTVLASMMVDTDVSRRDRVAHAMLQMKKLDIAGLERAYAGDDEDATTRDDWYHSPAMK
jgi:predicted 3-demethylubiquinone-9 3-methyltransferase (glyoxalase superfamily)